ncbi:MAG: bifunctional folylpolyglutamate synthase/dihydrofolate synthase [Oscillospiraceae bacterium]|nr:bifunctional folylpolyglutamate synthase/dihydrofolate synthase [Oscillospiraceae bacterium]
MNFNECMDFISSYSRLGAKVTDLSRAEELMERIGNPEKDLKFVHIAGTNGKGSTLEYIANALELSGYRTGKFTSPFVTHYTDRIRINDREIDEKSLSEICGFVAEHVADRKYSQFEITMAIAFLWYKRENCDIVVLETGIGGLLDSTNVIPSPLLSVITSISLDHTAILGDTVEKIAVQKAGIIKENSAVVLSIDNKNEVSRIVKETALKKHSEFIQPGYNNFKYQAMESDGMPFIYKGEQFKTAMLGFHQPCNAVTAIEACRYLKKKGFFVPEYAIRKSIETTNVKARVQYIKGNPPVIVDGGHNPAGINTLAMVIDDIRLKGKKIFTVMGMVDSKDYKSGIEKIARYSEKIFLVDGFINNAVSSEKLKAIAEKYADSQACDFKSAIEKVKSLAVENNGIVVVCGSLYLASEYLNIYQV